MATQDLMGPAEAAPSIGDAGRTEDPGEHNLWAAVAIQPLDVGIGWYVPRRARVSRKDGPRPAEPPRARAAEEDTPTPAGTARGRTEIP
nr:hypothetical protein StreXyl84_16620 [Streptomyces sp. Xyl84]